MNTSFLKRAVASSWLTCPQPNPQAKMRLFCFPYAGGSAQLYHKWAARLPSAVEVCPVQLPGRESMPPWCDGRKPELQI